jgi:hypothetical protein
MSKLVVKTAKLTSGLLCLTPLATPSAANACGGCSQGVSTPTGSSSVTVSTPAAPIAPATNVHVQVGAPASAPKMSTPTPIAPPPTSVTPITPAATAPYAPATRSTVTTTFSPANRPGTNTSTSFTIGAPNYSTFFARVPDIQQRLAAAQAAFDSASAKLSQIQTASQGPVRYARIPSEGGDCGCLNPDNVSMSGEMESARAEEAEAASRLAEAQTEARQFLDSAKVVTGGSSPLW